MILQFTVPRLTTEGLPVERVTAADARGGPSAGTPLSVDAWAESARRISSNVKEPGLARLEEPVGDWVGNEIVVGVRIAGRKGRFSEWSNLVTLQVTAPLTPPTELRADPGPLGVRLHWKPANERPELSWRIFRRGGDQQDMTRIGTSDKPEFTDTMAEYGKTYEYAVQAASKAGTQEAESDLTPAVSITPVDTFAPETPGGLTALAGADSIELAWDPRTEPDLRGYRVHRALGDAEFAAIGDILETPAYSDRQIESGKRYRYAVTAIDKLGNESAPTQPVEIVAP